MTWSSDCRLDHIDLLLISRGQVNRSDLVERFGISALQASADIGAFRRQYRGAMRYDDKRKCYVARDGYESRRGMDHPHVARALGMLAEAGNRMGWAPSAFKNRAPVRV